MWRSIKRRVSVGEERSQVMKACFFPMYARWKLEWGAYS